MARLKIVKFFVDDAEYGELKRLAGDVALSKFCRQRVFERITVPVGAEPRRAAESTGVHEHQEVARQLDRNRAERGTRHSDASAEMPTAPKPITTQDVVIAGRRRRLANRYCKPHHFMGCERCILHGEESA